MAVKQSALNVGLGAERINMTLDHAIKILMKSAEKDVQGCGQGIRSTSDDWREEVSKAWAIAYKKVYGMRPDASAYTNSGMRLPNV